MQIPKLIKVKEPPFKLKRIYEVEDDFIDTLKKEKYIVKILDVFSYTLSQEDERLKLLDDEYFRLTQEEKYLCFTKKMFELNSNEVYVIVGTNFSNLEVVSYQLTRLDKIDEFLILNFFKSFFNSPFGLIKDVNLLNLFIKGMLRESISAIIYFEKIDFIISYGFDLSLPVGMREVERFEKIANGCGLYFR